MARNSWVVDSVHRAVQLTRGDRKRIFDTSELSDEIKELLMLHGLKQKLADASANPDADPIVEADRVWGNLQNRIWAERRAEDVDRLILAVAEVKFAGDKEKATALLTEAGALDKDGDSEEDSKKRKALRAKLRKAEDLKGYFPTAKKGIDDILGK